METKNLDVVYICREGDDNEELRYSLRSIEKNLPHRQTFIVGYRPSWATEKALLIPNKPYGHRFARTLSHYLRILKEEKVTNNFILFHDDIFVMKEMDTFIYYHKEQLEETTSMKQPSQHVRRKLRTRKWLRDHGRSIYDYSLHVPFMMDKKSLARYANIRGIADLETWTMYGNLNKVGGLNGYEEFKTWDGDVKIIDKDQEPYTDTPFLSTFDATFQESKVGKYIRDQFPDKSDYEK